MQFKIRCVCGQCYHARPEFAGKQMRCRQCRQLFTIPFPRKKKWVATAVYDHKLNQVLQIAMKFSSQKVPSDAFDAAVSSAGIPQAGTWEDELDFLEEKALRQKMEAKTVLIGPDMTEAYNTRDNLPRFS
ncbi:MAG: hypothetical protein O3B01_11510 [Planctomycetota bacterium]|nr:hypothetical protein [Planctomycetota bacterium]MDA1139201.1 hypothetical protein [Planctomycetota bacterium]